MTTKAQRLRVILALDCLASQESPWRDNTHYLLGWDTDDDKLACRAFAAAYGADTWRERYAEAAQLIKEGAVS